MKAIWNNQVIAETENENIIHIEGNAYFPPDSVQKDFLKPSDTHTTCFWKGEASYYNLEVEGQRNDDAAWYYPEPLEGSVEKVKKDFKNYVAFWRGVQIEP